MPQRLLIAILLGLLAPLARSAEPEPLPVSIRAHFDQPRGAVKPIWPFFGYDEANYTFMPEGKVLLAEIAKLSPQPAYIRCHHLLTSGDGSAWLKWSSTNVYTEDADGKPVYNFTILDRILDTYHALGLKPYLELGFMPEALSSKPERYTPKKVTSGRPDGMVEGGAFYPPKDYGKWQGLVEAIARHCAERYGKAEAESWYWELWNEPNIMYWRGTQEEFFKLYDYTAAGLKKVLPSARIGGPETAGPGSSKNRPGGFTRHFLEHCLRGTNAVTGGRGAPLDFLVFHAKGGTDLVDGHVRMNLGNHLRLVDTFASVAEEYPELKGKPIIIGESDPDGCAACSAHIFKQNGYRNTSQYAAYSAATFMREADVAARHGGNLVGALTWAFEFENQPWFDGFRVLSTHDTPLPVFNAFRMFSLLQPTRIALDNSAGRSLDQILRDGARRQEDVDAVASRSDHALTVLLWHYADLGAPGPDVPVELTMDGLPDVRNIKLSHWRIDETHSNAHTAWVKMGSPQNPTAAQRAELKKASELTLLEPPSLVSPRDGAVKLQIVLPRQSVSLVRLEW